jgi:hypothetical protein
MPESPPAASVPFEGHSVFLRWAPKGFLVLAALMVVLRWPHWVQWTTLFVALAFVHARWLAWRFTVTDDGLLLTFPFGRRVFYWKEQLTVRMEVVGAIALVGRHRRFGYLLFDSILYHPDRDEVLRRAFATRGFQVIGASSY